jgi:putative addiction module CopG family antidote
MSVTLTPEVKQFLEKQVASGAYRDESEVLTETVRLLRDQQERFEKRLALLADLEQGIASLNAGRKTTTTATEILANMNSATCRATA